MVIFALDQVPEMTRGRGVRLQRHKDGGLSDVTTFKADEGLRWIGEGGRTSNLSIKELAAWRGNRGDAGRVRPDRFLANLKFGRPPETGNGKSGNDKNGGANGT
jgi:topoisomerase-4 subunit A